MPYRIRVLHLTTHLNTGGITSYIEKLIKPLKEIGVDVHVATSQGEYVESFTKEGCPVYCLPIRTKSELHPKIYFAIPKLLKIIRENQIDIIHAHTRITQVMGEWIKFISKKPLITTSHGFYKRRLGRRLFPAWGDRVIAISDGVGNALLQDFNVPKDKLLVISNAVNFESTNAAYSLHDSGKVRELYGFHREDPVIGIVARLVEDKGHEYLLRAVAELKLEFPNIKLLIVGDGRSKHSLEKIADELGIKDHVIFTGNVKDVTYPLSAMDIFVLPATWREGFGLSIIEAMACKKPIIVTNIWALNTLIQDGITGIMVNPKETEPIVQAIRRYLKDPIYRFQIAENGQKMVEQRFSIFRMAREIADLYESVKR
jgi:glycosyltransferase involved in cell wall biosynthesis